MAMLAPKALSFFSKPSATEEDTLLRAVMAATPSRKTDSSAAERPHFCRRQRKGMVMMFMYYRAPKNLTPICSSVTGMTMVASARLYATGCGLQPPLRRPMRSA